MIWYMASIWLYNALEVFMTLGGHSIVRLKTMCERKKSIFSKLNQQNESKLYQKKTFMSTYIWYLLHSKN